jgi:hypothetical protein
MQDDLRPPPQFFVPGIFIAAIMVIASCWLIYLIPA